MCPIVVNIPGQLIVRLGFQNYYTLCILFEQKLFTHNLYLFYQFKFITHVSIPHKIQVPFGGF